MSPEHEFEHFVEAQEPIYAQVVQELASGKKQSHWMWFIFPQLAGLGSSAMSQRYALDSLESARRYLEHPLLGARLKEVTQLVLETPGRTAEQIFGMPDCLKFHSSMTLFARSVPEVDLFQRALDKFFNGQRDPLTEQLLR